MKYAYFNPITVAVEDVPEDAFAVLKQMSIEAHNHPELDFSTVPGSSTRGGQQIQMFPNDYNLDTTVLKDFVESRCQEYCERLTQITGQSDLLVYKPTMVSAWALRQGKGDYQTLHSHDAHISGNIYIDVPNLDSDSHASDGCLEFRLPATRNTSRFVFADNWKFTPEVAKMVVFPSYLAHTVYPWKGKGYRTVIAWDAILVDPTK